MLLGPARSNTLQKPLLVICITDGAPAGEPADKGKRNDVRSANEVPIILLS